jgi:hypothetical protein
MALPRALLDTDILSAVMKGKASGRYAMASQTFTRV